eukprot:16675-Heterococcus_DN1.PRE.1
MPLCDAATEAFRRVPKQLKLLRLSEAYLLRRHSNTDVHYCHYYSIYNLSCYLQGRQSSSVTDPNHQDQGSGGCGTAQNSLLPLCPAFVKHSTKAGRHKAV